MAFQIPNSLAPFINAGITYGLSEREGLNEREIGQGGQTAQKYFNELIGGQQQQQLNQNLLGSYNNPYLDQSIAAGQRNLSNQFYENTLPQINQAFSNAGSFGSGRQAALTEQATRDFNIKLADVEAQQRANAYDAAYQAAYNAGANQYAAQQNAASKLFAPAVNIAGQDPLVASLAALSGQGGQNYVNTINSGINLAQDLWDWLT